MCISNGTMRDGIITDRTSGNDLGAVFTQADEKRQIYSSSVRDGVCRLGRSEAEKPTISLWKRNVPKAREHFQALVEPERSEAIEVLQPAIKYVT